MANSSELSQEANLGSTRALPDEFAGQDGPLLLSAPSAAFRSVHPVGPDQVVGADFSPSAVEALLEGADLVLAFANGGAIVLEGYMDALLANHPPQLVFEDGTIYTIEIPQAHAAASTYDAPDLAVASGLDAQGAQPESLLAGGSHAYDDQGEGAFDALGLQSAGEGRSSSAGTPGERRTAGGDPPSFEPPASPLDAPGEGEGAPAGPAAPTGAALPGPGTTPPAAPPVTPPVGPPATPGNNAPDSLTLSGGSLDELLLAGALAGTANATDPDAGDNLTFSLSNDAGGRFVIDPVSGRISTTGPLDFETGPSHAIVVRVTDSAGATLETGFTITVGDISEIAGGPGADVLSGTPQLDVIDGGDGNDQISAGDGNDIVLGGIGLDTLNGEAGDDALFGEAQNDILDGGPGADVLFGGSGNDVLRIDADDVVVDGGSGVDTVQVQGAGGVTLDMTAGSIELATGGAGDDSFDAGGSSAGTQQDGAGGDDTLIGGNAGDGLMGGAGNDTLVGGAGNDSLDGGAGDDNLTGGTGADIFILRATGDPLSPGDLLSDFEDGVDRIGLESSLSLADLTSAGNGAGGATLSVTATGEVLAVLNGIDPSLLDNTDFTTII